MSSLARLVVWLVGGTVLTVLGAGGNLIPNGDFTDGLEGWRPLWTRDAHAGQLVLTNAPVLGSKGLKPVACVIHSGSRDWSLTQGRRYPVQPGEILELTALIEVHGEGSATPGLVTYDPQGRPLDWSFGGEKVTGSAGWTALHTRLIIPEGVAAIEPRVIGEGPAQVRLARLALFRRGTLEELRDPDLPKRVSFEAGPLIVTLDTESLTLRVRDRRNGRLWVQRAVNREMVARELLRNGQRLRLGLLHVPTGGELELTLAPAGEAPEFTVTLGGDCACRLKRPWAFPHPFVTNAGTWLVVPMNEGISYPVTDPVIEPIRLIAYGGHGICMAFWGVSDGQAGQMAIIETPDDAAVRIARVDGRLCVRPEWDAQKGRLGYPRRLRYIFFDQGGHVVMAKRYRAYAQSIGRFRTLAEKRAVNPHVDLLVGAVNVWCWEDDAVGIVREMQAAGIDRILWSHRQPPEVLRRLNQLGVLTSRYDIYQDAMNPADFPMLRGVHPDWTSEAWPEDLMIGPDGEWIRGWRVKGRDGQWHPCGVLCDLKAPEYAARRIPPELATHPYRCRFIDTTTASPFRECYAPAHPMTRTDSRLAKMRLLQYVSGDLNLVCGSETGHDAAVPYVHYFEGMMSLGPYRVPDAGRDMQRIWTEVPERVAKFQLGHRYRLPLWELVYHECVVAQWYWGDYNNKLPALWDKRDRFNALYGTPPMFMFDRRLWREQRDRFIRSYREAATVARLTGYSEMIDHRFLTPDRDVQQTLFANGVRVTVNFGDRPFRLADGSMLPPGDWRCER